MYTVKIITKCGDHTIVEKAGVCGVRTLVSVAGAKGIRTNQKQKKLNGWKTREGAQNFIAEDLINAIKMGWQSTYEIEIA